MYNKAIGNNFCAIQFVSDQCKAQKVCGKAADTCPFVFHSVSDQYKTQEMCDKFVSKESFMLKYCLDWYKSQTICDKAVDAFLLTLNFVPDWFVTSKMFAKLDNVVYSNYINLDDLDSDMATFFRDDMAHNTKALNNINLDDDNFDKDDLPSIAFVRLTAWQNRFGQPNACKKR